MKPISVIVIAYNAEKTIERALKSVINQTMRDIEIICVDDCSTDRTHEILNWYAQIDKRIIVCHHERNMGLFAARNTGIEHSSGQYVLHIDSDDEMIENACEYLYKEVCRQNVDILQFGVTVKSDSQKPAEEYILNDIKNLLKVPEADLFTREPEAGELLKLCFVEKKISFNVWNKIYKTELLRKAYAQYDGERILMAEDCLMTFMVLCYAKTYGVTNHAFYIYYVGGGMSTEITRLDEKKIQRTAEEYQVYTLLKQWVKQTGVSTKQLIPCLKAVHSMMSDAIFWYFLHEMAPEDRGVFHKYLCKYYPTRELVDDLTTYVFDQHRVSYEDFTSRMKGYPAFHDYSSITTIKTIGMFYYRLYNGGIERVMALLTPIFMKMGYRVVIITEQPENEKDYPLPEETTRVCLRAKGSQPQMRVKEFQKIIRENHIDVMIYHAWVAQTLVMDAFAIKSMSIPLILHTHLRASEAFEWAGCHWHDQERLYALFDFVITLSEVDNAWWSSLGFRTARVANPPVFSIQETEVVPLNNKNCIWIGRLAKEKQYVEAFEIARLVHDEISEFRLHIVGNTESTEEFREIMQYITRNGMYEYVLFHGYQEDVRPYYQNASVFLSTSSVEGAPMTFIESKTFGIPMVAYDLPNIDMLRNPKGAIVVKQHDTVSAAKHIIRLLNDKEELHRLGLEARKSVEEIYRFGLEDTWKDILTQVTEVGGVEKHLSELPPIETAVRLAMRSVAVGVWSTQALRIPPQRSDASYNDLLAKHKALWEQFEESAQAGKEAWEKYEQTEKEKETLWRQFEKASQEGKEIWEKYELLLKENKELWERFEQASREGKDAWSRYEQVGKAAEEAQTKIREIEASKSYRLGKVLTLPVRKIRSLLM